MIDTVLTYFFTLFIIVLSVFITLSVKSELERLFRDKKAGVPFHICNVVIIVMVSVTAHAIITVYIMGNELNLMLQPFIHLAIVLPIYLVGHITFEKYKIANRKYIPTENRKVIVINDKYLNGEKRSSRFKNYNEFSKEK